jgi:hypothetical protein
VIGVKVVDGEVQNFCIWPVFLMYGHHQRFVSELLPYAVHAVEGMADKEVISKPQIS